MEMSDAEKKLYTIMHRHVIAAAEVAEYRTWTDEFSVKNIREAHEEGLLPEYRKSNSIGTITKAEILSIPVDRLRIYGFGNWDGKLDLLVPLYLLDYLDDDDEVEDIFEETKKVVDAKLDNDHRGGCLAFGWRSQA